MTTEEARVACQAARVRRIQIVDEFRNARRLYSQLRYSCIPGAKTRSEAWEALMATRDDYIKAMEDEIAVRGEDDALRQVD
jgi:hypothetical protein